MEEKYKIMGIIGLIALRKSELYYKIVGELSKGKQISEEDKEKIKKHIAKMQNERFLNKGEKEDKKINSRLKLEDMNLNIKEIIQEIKV